MVQRGPVWANTLDRIDLPSAGEWTANQTSHKARRGRHMSHRSVVGGVRCRPSGRALGTEVFRFQANGWTGRQGRPPYRRPRPSAGIRSIARVAPWHPSISVAAELWDHTGSGHLRGGSEAPEWPAEARSGPSRGAIACPAVPWLAWRIASRPLRLGAFPGNMHLFRQAGKSVRRRECRDCSRYVTPWERPIGCSRGQLRPRGLAVT